MFGSEKYKSGTQLKFWIGSDKLLCELQCAMKKTVAEREAELVVQRSATIEANNKQEVSWVHIN